MTLTLKNGSQLRPSPAQCRIWLRAVSRFGVTGGLVHSWVAGAATGRHRSLM
jgi:hypothetical protein